MWQEAVPPPNPMTQILIHYRDTQWLSRMLKVTKMKFVPGDIILEPRFLIAVIYIPISWSALHHI